MRAGSDPLTLMASIMEARDPKELFARAEAAAKSIGFERLLIGMEVSLPQVGPMVHITSGYPEAWQLRYAEKQYIFVDPTVSLCRTSTAPVVWNPGIYSERSFELMEEARQHGVGHGVSIGVHESPRLKSMVSLARDQRIDEDPRETSQMVAAGNVLANCLHIATSRLIVPTLLEEARPKLTPREREILQYVAAGKSSGVISDLLSISAPTVEFHVQNVFKKLGVATRLQAVAKAISLGLVN